MFILKDASIHTLTLELAQEHVRMTKLIGERPLDKSRVEELKAEIEAGTFSNPIWVIAVLKSSGKYFRADGQHTATALTSVPKNQFPVGCRVLIVYYEIDSLEEDAAHLFLRIDDSDAVRNSTATMNSLAVHYRDLHAANPRFVVSAVNGIVYHLKEFNKKQKERDKRVKIHKPKLRGLYLTEKNYRIFILWLNHWNTLTDAKTGEHRKASNEWLMKKPAVVAEAMATYFAYSEAANKFWDYMLDDAGPKGHPTKGLVGTFNDWRSRPRNKVPKPEQWTREVRRVWKDFLVEFEAEKTRSKKRAS